jgi:hypothetical protein
MCRGVDQWLGLDFQGHTTDGGYGRMPVALPSTDCKDAPLDLDLDIAASLIGRKTAPVRGEVLRELTEADLALLATERGIQPSHIARLSERHHALARCLASGLSVADACAITGYTPSRVSILKGDPSFEELIAFYTAGKAELVQDLGDRLRAVALDAAAELQERLEDKPGEFSVDALHDTIKLGADRSGFGPASKTTNVNVHVNLAGRLAEARKRVEGRVIENLPLAPALPPEESK